MNPEDYESVFEKQNEKLKETLAAHEQKVKLDHRLHFLCYKVLCESKEGLRNVIFQIPPLQILISQQVIAITVKGKIV